MTTILSRRTFLGLAAAAGGAATLGNSPAFALSTGLESPRLPNILLILADDLGFSDLGFCGSEIDTPNVDRLAAQGMRFTQFYNCAVCCPTRASLLTGVYPHKAGMGGMNDRNGDGGRPLAYIGDLNDRCLTIAEALSSAGYHSLMSGKWHVGERRPHWPLDRGFERYYGLISGACSYFDSSFLEPGTDKVRTMARDNTGIVERGDGFYMTDAITDHAVGYLKEYSRRSEPFFLYVAYTAPHFPLHALPEDIRKYQGKYLIGWDRLREVRHRRMIDRGIVNAGWVLSKRDVEVPAWNDIREKAWEDMRMAVYAAQVDRLDQGVGRILSTLKEVGAEDNTLVIFLSDNGGCATVLKGNDPTVMPGSKSSYMSYGRGWSQASNTPLRLHKTWLYEGGISTPLIARWPGHVPSGRVVSDVGHVADLMPTFLALAGATYPEKYRGRTLATLDGSSLLPVMLGGNRPAKDKLFWELFGHCAMRQGPWKLVKDRDRKQWELYNIEEDRTETTNLAAGHASRVREMVAAWQAWADQVGVIIDPNAPWLKG
jgi:arylsulfatase